MHPRCLQSVGVKISAVTGEPKLIEYDERPEIPSIGIIIGAQGDVRLELVGQACRRYQKQHEQLGEYRYEEQKVAAIRHIADPPYLKPKADDDPQGI